MSDKIDQQSEIESRMWTNQFYREQNILDAQAERERDRERESVTGNIYTNPDGSPKLGPKYKFIPRQLIPWGDGIDEELKV